MLSGDQRILCEKPQYMSNSRQSVPSAKYFCRQAPDTVYVTELRGSDQEILWLVVCRCIRVSFRKPRYAHGFKECRAFPEFVACQRQRPTTDCFVEDGFDTTGRRSSVAKGTIHCSFANPADWILCLFSTAPGIQRFSVLGHLQDLLQEGDLST